VATEFVDTDWDDDDILSDSEDALENSPRHSLKSVGNTRSSKCHIWPLTWGVADGTE
jgi:hypothetical protein